MARQRKAKASKPKITRPRINWLYVFYVLVAVAVVFSLVAGAFGSNMITTTGQTTSTSSQQPVRDTGPRIAITVVPPPATPTPATP